MSYSNINDWRIVDKDGNELDITDVFTHGTVNIEVLEYDPTASALAVLHQAIEAEFD